MKYSGDEQLATWKKEMNYEEVKEEMMNDPILNRLCSPVGKQENCNTQTLQRVIVTPNIEPTEETLDMSCFLSAVDKEEEDEEIPELVEDEAMEMESVDDEELLA